MGWCSVQMEGFKEGGSDSSLSRKEFRVRFESAHTKENRNEMNYFVLDFIKIDYACLPYKSYLCKAHIPVLAIMK